MLKSVYNTVNFARKMISYKKVDEEFDRVKSASFLVEIARAEGGILYKFLQYLNTDTRFEDLEHLAAKNNFEIPIEEVIEIFETQFQVKWTDYFKVVNESDRPKLASLSQVHFIEASDGNKFVLKVQYPDIKARITKQLKMLKVLPHVTPKKIKKWGVDFSRYQIMFQTILDQELDYIKEAQNLKRLRALLAKDSDFVIARVDERFVGPVCFIQDYIEGESFEAMCKWDKLTKERVLYNLFKSYLQLFFETGYYQGDTNFGNFLFDRVDSKVGFIDLGQLQFLPLSKREVLIDFLKKLSEKKSVDYFSYYLSMGFDEKKICHLIDYLPFLTDIIFAPFLSDSVYDLKSWQYKKKLDLLLGEKKWWFRSAGDEDFFLLMKSFTGIKSIIEKAGVALNFSMILKDVLNSVELDTMDIVLKRPKDKYSVKSISRTVRFKVVRNDEEKVNLKLPVKTLFDIEEYMSIETLKLIESKGIVLEEVVKKAFSDGGAPKNLICLIDSNGGMKKEIYIDMIE